MKAHLPVCVICMSLGFQMWCLFADSSGDGGYFPLFVWFFFFYLSGIFTAQYSRKGEVDERVDGYLNARAHKVCMKDFCVRTDIIVVARETHQTELGNTGAPSLQGPVTITASNPGVLIPMIRMHTEGVTSSISRSLETLCWCCRSLCCLWQCFGWKLSLKNIGATSAKHLRLMAALCHRDQSPYPLGTNQNTLLSQLSRCGAQCWEVNWHLFWFVCVPLYSS